MTTVNETPREIPNVENVEDEVSILTDRDLTTANDLTADDQRQAGRLGGNLEDEPADFVRGEVDVLEQMRRTSRAMDEAISSHHNLDDPADEPKELHGGLDDPNLMRKPRAS